MYKRFLVHKVDLKPVRCSYNYTEEWGFTCRGYTFLCLQSVDLWV